MAFMSNDLQHKIDHLETQLAFQEDTIECLNQALSNQQFQIDKMDFKLQQVMERIKQMEPSNIAGSDEEVPPPHY